MDPLIAMVIALLALLILIAIETPIALAIAASGAMGIILLEGTDHASQAIGAIAFTSTAKYALVVIPMYILLGCTIANAGIGERIYSSVHRVVGRLPGGLGATAVLATALFSGISGSSAADVATFGRISVNEMSKYGYSKSYAAAIVAAAGAFAVLIPPAIGLVVYGIIAEESIGAMILAGVVPGLLSCLALATVVVGAALVDRRRTRSSVAVAVGTVADSVRTSDPAPDGGAPAGARRSSLGTDLMGMVYAAVLFVVVIGGLYGGIFTATEAGAMGAFAAIVIAVLARRGREVSLGKLLAISIRETVDTTSMIFLLLIGGSIFAYLMALSGIPSDVADWASALPVSPQVVVAVALLLLLPLGMFLDGLTILLLTVPVLAPVVVGLGLDGVWFGILVMKVIEIGLITPPVGLNAFIISGVAGVRVETVFRRLVPFVFVDLAFTAVLFVFPELTLWLPRLAGVHV